MDTLQVLVASDDAELRFDTTRMLRDFRVWVPDVDDEVGFTVEAGDGLDDALARARRQPPDLLLLDATHAEGTELELLERATGGGAEPLTVLVTPHAAAATAALAARRAGCEVLARPFGPVELRGALQKVAARPLLAKRARRLADEKRQVRFEFVRVLGHELKAPLAAVTGYLDIVRERQLGGELAGYDEVLARCATRIEGMRRLIGDLLDLTRIESGQGQRRLDWIDLRAVATAALETQRTAADARGIALELEPGDGVVVHGDAGELEMIANNLVSNAVKYNRDGGRVLVTVRRDGARARFAVADTGIGMSHEALARVGEEFVRIRNAATAHIEGSGLGLSIVRKLVQLYGGTLAAESEPGQGTTMTISLVTGLDAPHGA